MLADGEKHLNWAPAPPNLLLQRDDRGAAHHIKGAKSADQLGILYDAWALGQTGYAPITNYLELIRAIPVDADPHVWLQIFSTLVSVDRLYEGAPGHAVGVNVNTLWRWERGDRAARS